jgi:hypothetical protein
MKFYDLEDSAQTLIQSPQSEDLGLDSKFEKTNFEGWNI